ncbi:sporulation peptidase YabG [Paenibacillus antri]|uniref:Sporulation peptidase YabG n=1 Tax=Paenibacillus antri TaxID=2582848 RepID=A0A5R9G785_9BACL|nr:sporulation peptidase YabG [Paenibacillus antri]TLS48593.1 sporulation peptidase YabG [Paenibacillus antri]
MKIGDCVVRKSYGKDVLFRIQDLKDRQAVLKGVSYRLLADAPLDDLEPATEPMEEDVRGVSLLKQSRLRIAGLKRSAEPYFDVPGTILHLDGDRTYLRKSIAVYNELRIPAEGYHLQESDMAEALRQLLPAVQPDIVVITGHDAILKHRFDGDKQNIRNYKNSMHFVQAVRVARAYERNRDAMTIIAGACQSHFEALLQAGANFASSPSRILIHALDPVYIAAKSAFTPVKDTVNIYDVITHTVSGLKGLGGIETRGNYRMGLPRIGPEN